MVKIPGYRRFRAAAGRDDQRCSGTRRVLGSLFRGDGPLMLPRIRIENECRPFPTATSTAAIRNVRLTSISDIQTVAANFRLGSKGSHVVDFDVLEAACRSEGGSSRIERDTPDNAAVLASLRVHAPPSKGETWQRHGQGCPAIRAA
jgi:hypothetical protein